ncbi:aminoacyl-tRNA hydrolase [Candidatus Gottesmanbacteria bacterium RIFCSPHIGHO2_02_FULL_39_11]|uniref:Peptidyl-tRNA hydrolase n=1 Tax=Candidatus Gottesmanbacteria bacterium RIFCSPHIGHO2_02_FULL_39_11 TaxID=1798382 RepID=A0A1F5ZL95_9BACT|nr:MAG: aminoacyl-tRNA hydrolase [Candidatus Gottesmanbacteria bacterium RIFCSPHIGHO2_02_FULL_39_11]
MKLIVGLGNPGGKYSSTRHNIGFMVVDQLVKDKLSLEASLKAWKKEDKFLGFVCKLDTDVLILKPETYMNVSGKSVAALANFYKIPTRDIYVVHDDIDLPLGKIRIRRGGASAGHHGIDSIIRELGDSEFFRFRLGIGRGKLDKPHSMDQNLPRQEVEKYVVSRFHDSEASDLKKLLKKATEALSITLKKDIFSAMNQFN